LFEGGPRGFFAAHDHEPFTGSPRARGESKEQRTRLAAGEWRLPPHSAPAHAREARRRSRGPQPPEGPDPGGPQRRPPSAGRRSEAQEGTKVAFPRERVFSRQSRPQFTVVTPRLKRNGGRTRFGRRLQGRPVEGRSCAGLIPAAGWPKRVGRSDLGTTRGRAARRRLRLPGLPERARVRTESSIARK